MPWSYANWESATEALTIASTVHASRQFTLAGDRRGSIAVGDLVVRSGAADGLGTYRVEAVAYTPDTTTVTVEEAIAGAATGGTLTVGPSQAIAMRLLRQHLSEVRAQVQASVASSGSSYNAETLRSYLADLNAELRRLERAVRGTIARGRLPQAGG